MTEQFKDIPFRVYLEKDKLEEGISMEFKPWLATVKLLFPSADTKILKNFINFQIETHAKDSIVIRLITNTHRCEILLPDNDLYVYDLVLNSGFYEHWGDLKETINGIKPCFKIEIFES